MWQSALGELRFSVEHRDDPIAGGPSLVVADAFEREWLRFDCFEQAPSYVLDPKGANEVHPLPALADPVAWTCAELGRDLTGYLARAGWDLDVAPGAALADVLADAEAVMRNPPVELETLDRTVLEARLSEKWNTYPADVLPAWVAEMDFPLAEPVRLVLQRAALRGDVGYPIAPRSTGIAETFAARMAERFDWTVDPARVEVLTDVVQGQYVALEAFATRRRGVVVQTPIYPPFLRAVEDTERRLVENPLQISTDDPPRMTFDLDALEAQVDDDTAVVLLCNPHNPSGRTYARAELERLARLALARDLVVVSDEIHADLVFEGSEHIPFGSLSDEIAERTVTLTSATKAFNIPGLRCAVAHFGSRELQQRFHAVHPRHVRGGIGLLGLYATIAAWQHAQPWLDTVLAKLDDNRRFLAEAFAERFPEIRFFAPEATYLAWLDCRALALAPTPGRFFLQHGRVALSDGIFFGNAYKGFARINFATSRAILEEVLDRIQTALDAR